MKKYPDWKIFHKWEEEYETRRIRRLTPLEKIEEVEELYLWALKIRGKEALSPWRSEEEAVIEYKKFLSRRA